jgi:hypothetical protein
MFALPSTRRLAGLAASALVGLLAINPAYSGEVGGLYEAEVPVSDKSEASREAALGEALARVVTKVTGEPRPKSNPTVVAAIASPGRFIQQFRYRVVEAEPGVEPAGAEQRWLLWARFDPGVVDGLVRDAGMRVWGRMRPAVMFWVAIEDAGTRKILGGEGSTELADVVREAARQRGVPVVLPLLDLEDQSRLRVSDVWGVFRDRIRAASDRYQTNVILTGRIYRLLPTLWEGQFSLLLEGVAEEWSSQGDILELLLSEGVIEVADRLAARFAGAGSLAQASGFGVVVSGVRSTVDYARTLDYFSKLEETTNVSVTRVRADEVSFHIETRGGREALLRVVGLSRILTPESLPDDPELRFRLMP